MRPWPRFEAPGHASPRADARWREFVQRERLRPQAGRPGSTSRHHRRHSQVARRSSLVQSTPEAAQDRRSAPCRPGRAKIAGEPHRQRHHHVGRLGSGRRHPNEPSCRRSWSTLLRARITRERACDRLRRAPPALVLPHPPAGLRGVGLAGDCPLIVPVEHRQPSLNVCASSGTTRPRAPSFMSPCHVPRRSLARRRATRKSSPASALPHGPPRRRDTRS